MYSVVASACGVGVLCVYIPTTAPAPPPARNASPDAGPGPSKRSARSSTGERLYGCVRRRVCSGARRVGVVGLREIGGTTGATGADGMVITVGCAVGGSV